MHNVVILSEPAPISDPTTKLNAQGVQASERGRRGTAWEGVYMVDDVAVFLAMFGKIQP
jgi:hypothetical protein